MEVYNDNPTECKICGESIERKALYPPVLLDVKYGYIHQKCLPEAEQYFEALAVATFHD